MSKVKKYGIAAVILAVILFIYYYITLPAVNIHAGGFWTSLIFILVVLLLMKALPQAKNPEVLKDNKTVKLLVFAVIGVVAAYIIGSILSSPIVNAMKYQQLMTVEEREFTEDIKQVSYDKYVYCQMIHLPADEVLFCNCYRGILV